MQTLSDRDSIEVRSLKDKLLISYKNIIRQDGEDPKKFVCRACKKKKSQIPQENGNCQGHLDSKTPKAALEDFNIYEDSDSVFPQGISLLRKNFVKFFGAFLT